MLTLFCQAHSERDASSSVHIENRLFESEDAARAFLVQEGYACLIGHIFEKSPSDSLVTEWAHLKLDSDDADVIVPMDDIEDDYFYDDWSAPESTVPELIDWQAYAEDTIEPESQEDTHERIGCATDHRAERLRDVAYSLAILPEDEALLGERDQLFRQLGQRPNRRRPMARRHRHDHLDPRACRSLRHIRSSVDLD